MSSPVALVNGRLAPVRGPRVTSQLAGQEGLEPPTAGFGDRDSSQLSYCPLHGTPGTLTQPDGAPSDLEVYVADRPSVERAAYCPPHGLLPGQSEKMLAMPSSNPRVSARIAGIAESATLAVEAKARALKAAGRPVIGFGAGEPDFPTPDYIVEAAQRACANPRFHKYSPTPGLPELRKAIAAKTARDSGLVVQPEQVLVTNGGKQAVYEAFATLIDPGDEVLLPAPYWTTYPEVITLAWGVSVPVVTDESSGYLTTVASLEAHCTDRTKALVFVSPSNPTGAVYPPELVAEIGRWAASRGLWAVTDEIYEHLVYGQAKFSSMPVAAPGPAYRSL